MQLLSTEAKMLEIYSKAQICQCIFEERRRECLDGTGKSIAKNYSKKN